MAASIDESIKVEVLPPIYCQEIRKYEKQRKRNHGNYSKAH